jgi:hypothetical protein
MYIYIYTHTHIQNTQGSGFIRNGRSLEPGELSRVFTKDGACKVLLDEVGTLKTGSGEAPASFFVAQKL